MPEISSPPHVAVLGLGAMGSRIAARWLESGFPVRVWNRSRSAAEPLEKLGAQRAATPREAAHGAGYVFSMVTDDSAARAVWLGAEGAYQGMASGAVAIEASTVTAGWIHELAGAVESRGAALLEAPVVGSRPQAEAGQLLSLVAGSRSDFEVAAPLLDAYSARSFFLGSLGLGASAKLAVNSFFATQIAAAGEILHFLRGTGLEDERALDLFANLPVVPAPIAGAMAAMAAERFEPLFPIRLVEKDLRYFREAARRASTPTPIGEAASALYAQALGEGMGELNIHAVSQLFATGASDRD